MTARKQNQRLRALGLLANLKHIHQTITGLKAAADLLPTPAHSCRCLVLLLNYFSLSSEVKTGRLLFFPPQWIIPSCSPKRPHLQFPFSKLHHGLVLRLPPSPHPVDVGGADSGAHFGRINPLSLS